MKIGNTDVKSINGAFCFRSGLRIDADGAPTAYGDKSTNPLDHLANAGHPGNWWGIVTHNGKPDGVPVVQGAGDPAPGYYVSPTSLVDRSKKAADPTKYVNSCVVPYISLPPELLKQGVKMGDVAILHYPTTGLTCVVLVADCGPHGKIGEGSIAAAAALGIPSNARHGGIDGGLITVVFPGTSKGWPRTSGEIQDQGHSLLLAWGGLDKLKAV